MLAEWNQLSEREREKKNKESSPCTTTKYYCNFSLCPINTLCCFTAELLSSVVLQWILSQERRTANFVWAPFCLRFISLWWSFSWKWPDLRALNCSLDVFFCIPLFYTAKSFFSVCRIFLLSLLYGLVHLVNGVVTRIAIIILCFCSS